MPSPRQPYRLADHATDVLAYMRRAGHDVSLDQLVPILAMFDENLRAWRSESAMEALEERRRRGVRYTRHAGYGYRWAGRRHHQKRVPDEGEWNALAEIVKQRQQGVSWREITKDFSARGIKTADGREWSSGRIRRAFAVAVSQSKIQPR
jgi:hypothetical protein